MVGGASKRRAVSTRTHSLISMYNMRGSAEGKWVKSGMVTDGGNHVFGQKFLPTLSKENWSHNNSKDMAPAGVGSEAQAQGRVHGEVDRTDLVFSETGLKGAHLKCMDTGEEMLGGQNGGAGFHTFSGKTVWLGALWSTCTLRHAA